MRRIPAEENIAPASNQLAFKRDSDSLLIPLISATPEGPIYSPPSISSALTAYRLGKHPIACGCEKRKLIILFPSKYHCKLVTEKPG